MLTTTRLPLADALTGALVLPDDPGWDDARSGFNLLLDQHPAAVAYPADAQDVAAAVAYARRAGLRVAPQATGHNQGPLGGLEETLLLNVRALQEVRVDPGASVSGSAPASSGIASRPGSRPTAWRACTARRPTWPSPGTRSGAAWGGWPASTGCRPTP